MPDDAGDLRHGGACGAADPAQRLAASKQTVVQRFQAVPVVDESCRPATGTTPGCLRAGQAAHIDSSWWRLIIVDGDDDACTLLLALLASLGAPPLAPLLPP